jgi:hypothetical protein
MEPEYLAAVEVDEPPLDPVRDESDLVPLRGEQWDDDYLMTYDQWWQEYADDACCSSPQAAAANFCGCRGSGAYPTGISRLLERSDRADYFFDDGGY